MGKARGETAGMPSILAVRCDRADEDRRAAPGGHAGSDVFSVYLRGGPKYRIGPKTYAFQPPAAILIPEGTFDRDLQRGRIEGDYVLFHGRDLVRPAQGRPGSADVILGERRLTAPCVRRLSANEADRLVGTINEMAAIRSAGLVARMRRIALLLRALADYCEGGADAEPAPGLHRGAAVLGELIEEHAFENIPLASLYDRLDLSAGHAEVLFKKAFGLSPVSYRTRLRLRRARELLVSSQLNVSQAARTVGFTDPLYFSRVFRRTFGVTPSSLIRDFRTTRK
jgi:AraC-like DNA-binding protein